MSNTQVEYKSEFLPDVTIVTIFQDDPNYSEVKKYFDEYGYGFMVPGKNLVIIDGENLGNGYNLDVLKFIEAHEIAHVLLKHSGPRDDKEEMEADLGAYLLLKKSGRSNSIKYLKKHFPERHGVQFKEGLLFDVRKKMGL
jgi:hypothetical protein